MVIIINMPEASTFTNLCTMKPKLPVLYGNSWCPDCRRARKLLTENGVAYFDVDIEREQQAAEFVEKLNKGNRSVPTIIFTDGSMLVEPSNSRLLEKIKELLKTN